MTADTSIAFSLPANQIIHPAFEIRPGLILFGFIERTVDPKTGKVEGRHVSIGRGKRRPFHQVGPLRYEHEGGRLIVDPKYDHPPRLIDEWSREDLDDFIASPTALDGSVLFRDLREAVDRHVDLGHPGASCILAVWTVLTFVYPIFSAVPFLLFLGPKATGKSQALDVLAKLCRCGHKSRATAASLGDLIEAQRVTPLIDQADLLGDELLQVLIDSYRQGATRTITNMDDRGNPHRFDTFGPKALAAHGDFDEDLLDRCIHIPMAPATRSVEALLADDDRLERLRWQLYRFAVKRAAQLYKLSTFTGRDAVGQSLELDGRRLELWWPLEVLFEWLEVPETDREVARAFYRRSLNTTTAVLSASDEALLLALSRFVTEGDSTFLISNSDLADATSAPGAHLALAPFWIGKRLGELGLKLDSGRPRLGGQRRTVYTIDVERLRHLLIAWEIDVLA